MKLQSPPAAAMFASYQRVPAAANVGELLRQLVGAAGRAPSSSCEANLPGDAEEILLDVDIDGRRYLLLQMPLARPARPVLSPREQEIARMVAAGVPSKTIASVLNISLWTVGTHLRRIFAKLGVNTRAAMVGKLHESTLVPAARNAAMDEAHAAVAKVREGQREPLRA